ncbi:hypothetical protein [Actinoplanes sp. NBRC 103695]|uniref:hypothetical protein n=1 Tax=Actinoplanes sp. NBRC 103695 TaxID=3032202 RepID=UPI0024A19B8F|nr:hypothetical protein [Actinoplanes sp. NBRC 103695]GLZ01338.1 hypothetical protein Acsp02_85890 [Actinoplanes sp. NBRC 103695]
MTQVDQPPHYGPAAVPPSGQPQSGQPPYGQPSPGPLPVPPSPGPLQAPPPPRGPGVVPPFPAPPTEGRRRRIGLGLGIGAGVLVLACGGAVAALAGLGVVMTNALNEQAQVVIGDYLDDVKAKRFGEAYDSLCAQTRATLSRAEFTSEAQTGKPIQSWQVGDLDLASVDLAVPVDVTYADGGSGKLNAYLGQDRETGQFQVCSVEE